jgi:pyrimidine-nucleoside phosphorylase
VCFFNPYLNQQVRNTVLLKPSCSPEGACMRAVDLIMKKRDGGTLSRREVSFFVTGFVRGDIPDYQMSALLMAVFYKGMNAEETSLLTIAMRDSGRVMDLSDVAGIKIDKHSTGGVGDKVSLVLAPLAASCGLVVPMMAGRGLGHTGGTLDKCEAIPGYSVRLSRQRFKETLNEVGYAIIGQSEDIVPADRLIYSLRDVTATVESIPLITASILSKKCAEGSDGFVFDVKTGSGAFMKTIEEAKVLAQSLVTTAKEIGKKVIAVITDMDEPLGHAIGNFLEIKETCECLQGKGPADVMEVTIHLTSRMLLLGRVCSTMAEAEEKCRRQIRNGAAWNKFLANVALQGGDIRICEDVSKGPAAPYSFPVSSIRSGYIKRIDAYKVGHAACLLGAGRAQKEDAVHPGCGILLKKKSGQQVEKGEEIAYMFTDRKSRIHDAQPLLIEAFSFSGQEEVGRTKILEEMGDV